MAGTFPEPWRMGAYGDIAQNVSVDTVSLYSEHSWSSSYHPRMNQQDYEELKRSIKEFGFKDPLIMEYSPTEGRALLIEGNHRLAIATDLGITYVPVRLVRSKSVMGRAVSDSKLITDAYVPGDIRPDMVFPTGVVK